MTDTLEKDKRFNKYTLKLHPLTAQSRAISKHHITSLKAHQVNLKQFKKFTFFYN
jgi:hypothetical protein